MSNPIKDILDKQKLQQDIDERNAIIAQYYETGYLDRDNTIQKIRELRLTNEKVAKITIPTVSVNAVPLACLTNARLIDELNMQISILKAEIATKATDAENERK